MPINKKERQIRIVSAPLQTSTGEGEIRGRMRIPNGPYPGGVGEQARGFPAGHVQIMTGRQYRIIRQTVTLVLFLLPGFLFPAALAGSVPGEAEVKAAFLLNFIKFVEWPDSAFGSPEDPYLISVVGNDSIEEALKGINGKTVSGRRVVVRKVSGLSSLERCHILFVGESEQGKVDQVLEAVKKSPVLTVADIEGFARRGGTIGFFREENRVRFEINEESAGKAGLKLNAKLLYLGKIVRSR